MPNSSSPIRPTDPGLTTLTVQTGFRTDTGPSRASNEDSVAVVSPGDFTALLTKGVLALVADGMGGHEGGEVASAIAAHRIPELYYSGKGDPQECLLEAFAAANHDIYEVARKNGKLTGMGTTCTAVAVVNGMAYLGHAGDSRAYLIRGGQMYCMTEDHSATMAMVKQGLLTMAQAKHHEDRNVILRAMGTHPKLEVDSWNTPFPLRPGDRMLLCSDGMYETIEDDELCSVACSREPQAACDELIRLAIERSVSDNSTVAILYLRGGDLPEARRS